MNKGFLRIGKWFFKPQELKDKSLGSRLVEALTHTPTLTHTQTLDILYV